MRFSVFPQKLVRNRRATMMCQALWRTASQREAISPYVIGFCKVLGWIFLNKYLYKHSLFRSQAFQNRKLLSSPIESPVFCAVTQNCWSCGHFFPAARSSPKNTIQTCRLQWLQKDSCMTSMFNPSWDEFLLIHKRLQSSARLPCWVMRELWPRVSRRQLYMLRGLRHQTNNAFTI